MILGWKVTKISNNKYQLTKKNLHMNQNEFITFIDTITSLSLNI